MTIRKIQGADLFCGAGGFTEGFRRACERIGLKYDFVAVNHWDVAIATHSANHPEVRHILDDMQRIKPRNVFPKGNIEILLAAPECTHHSRAAGGVPRNPQSRATAGFVIKWARALSPKVIIVENVKEFREWGPLGTNGKPLKRRKGELFNKWLKMLKRLGYSIDYRVLCAADYGDPTTRERLFVIARADGRPITWPEPTHARNGDANMFGSVRKWKSAKDHVIDWTDVGESIFSRKKPLSPNTMRRIYAGLAKFGGRPFLALLHGTSNVRDVDQPAPTVTASGAHLGLAQPFIIGSGGPQGSGRPRSVNDPCKTILADDHSALIMPFVIPQQSAGRPRSTEEPLPTVSGAGAISLVEPYMVALKHTTEGDNRRVYDTKKPMPTITTRPDLALAQPFLIQFNGTADAKSIDRPVPTIPTRDRFGLVQPQLVEITNGENSNERNGNRNAVDNNGGPTGRREGTDLERQVDSAVRKDGKRRTKAGGAQIEKRLPDSPGVEGQPAAHTVRPPDRLDIPTRAHSANKANQPHGRFQGEQQSAESGISQPLAEREARLPDRTESSNVPTVVPRNTKASQKLEAVRAELQPDSQEVGDKHHVGIQVQPFLVSYHGSSYPGGERIRSVEEPVPTIATANQYALVVPGLDGYALDIRFRMLKVRELARAQGFADDYQFTGTQEFQKKQIGNAVPGGMAEALCYSQLAPGSE